MRVTAPPSRWICAGPARPAGGQSAAAEPPAATETAPATATDRLRRPRAAGVRARVVRAARLDAVRVPGGGLAGLSARRERPDPRGDRHRQDLCGVAGADPRVAGAVPGRLGHAEAPRRSPSSGSRRSARWRETPRRRSARRSRIWASPGASSRAPATPPHGSGRGSRQRLPTALVTTPGESVSPSHSRRRGRSLRSSRAGRGRRVARAHGLEARGADRARARAAASFPTGAPNTRPVRDAGQSRRRPRHAPRPGCVRPAPAGTDLRRAWCRRRSRWMRSSRRRWSASPGPARSVSACCPRSSAPSRRARARSSSPTPGPPPRSGIRRCSRRDRTGPGSWRCTMARLDRKTREWVEDGLREGQAPLCGLHLDPRSRRGLHAGGPRHPGRKSEERGPPDPARRPERPPARGDQPPHLRARPTPSSWWTWPRRDRRSTRARSRRAVRSSGRSTCWPSTPSPWRSAAASAPDELLAEVRTAVSLSRPAGRRVALGAGFHHPGRQGAPGVPGVQQGRRARTGCIASPAVWSRCATGCPSARS